MSSFTTRDYQKENLVIEGAHIMFRNFSGTENKYNRAGDRNFCVEITDVAIAGALMEDGFNGRTLAPRDEEEDERYYIQVKVNYHNAPPSIYLVSRGKKTLLDEEAVGILDHADIANVDLIVRPYNWEIGGKKGIKGYVKTMYVTLEEDEFADKYADPSAPEEDDEDLPF